MGAFTEQIVVTTGIVDVWEILADIGAVADWNPAVKMSRRTSVATGQIGATRYCELADGRHLHEEIVEWRPLERLTTRLTNSNLPIVRADIQFSLKQIGNGTLIRVRPDYDLRYGAFGALLDSLLFRGQYVKSTRAMLGALRRCCEQRVAA